MPAFPLSEGIYFVDASKNLFPDSNNSTGLENKPSALKVIIQPFLIQTPTDNILTDCGLGKFGTDGKLQIHKNLQKHNLRPEDITKVLLSHLHKDHADGAGYIDASGVFHLSFPNAHYYVQKGEWEYANKTGEPSYSVEKLALLKHSGHLIFLEGSGKITPEIAYERTGGHTPHHQIFIITAYDETFFYGGDVFPLPEHLLFKFRAKYDHDGMQSLKKRIEYGKKAAGGEWFCLFFHSAGTPIAKFILNNNIFKLVRI